MLSRFSDARAPSKKQTDAYYSRIAAKLDKTHAELSLEDVDRTLAYLEHIGLTKGVALAAVAMHPMVRAACRAWLVQEWWSCGAHADAAAPAAV